MELLERDGALVALAEAHAAAAGGSGRVVFVSGEPGIGKTSLVTRFVQDLEPGGRVLLGTCDDLAIPRPLGPIRDLVGTASASLEQALDADAPAHEIHGLLIAELDLPPRPTVLVLEDVHWADEATLDAITVLGRRIASLPALLVLTFRGGEVPRGHPLHAAVGAIRADDSVFLELAPLSEGAVASLAGEDSDSVYAATAGNPFYVNELLAFRADAALPPSVANAVLGRASRLDEDAWRLVQLVSVVPNRVRTAIAALPLPQATSRTRQPACRSTALQRVSATGWISVATAWKSPLAHICCWLCFTFARSGTAVSEVVIRSGLLGQYRCRVRRYDRRVEAASGAATHLRTRAYLSRAASPL